MSFGIVGLALFLGTPSKLPAFIVGSSFSSGVQLLLVINAYTLELPVSCFCAELCLLGCAMHPCQRNPRGLGTVQLIVVLTVFLARYPQLV